ncbi:InlB B-repeat-containing protein [Lysinibacillus xylanilyticus]|uniref:InlB B-repeat-containing protein n=1 Tax=Lysinibacillus xylanilyticus TaxID=582475 RepID=UPI00399D2B5C
MFHGKPQFSSDKTPFNQQYKEGKTFGGWFEDLDHTIKWSNTVPQSMTIYMMWDLPNNCTVTFESNGGNNVPAKTIKCRNLLIEPTNPMKEGYIFVGRY